MESVTSQQLRHHTADVLRQVAEGSRVTVTVHGSPVAEIGPVSARRRPFLLRSELADILATRQADPGLRDDLAVLAGETTDDRDPL